MNLIRILSHARNSFVPKSFPLFPFICSTEISIPTHLYSSLFAIYTVAYLCKYVCMYILPSGRFRVLSLVPWKPPFKNDVNESLMFTYTIMVVIIMSPLLVKAFNAS